MIADLSGVTSATVEGIEQIKNVMQSLDVRYLAFSNVRLELIQYLEPAGSARDLATNVPGAAHLCLDVPDVRAAYRELVARTHPESGETP